METREAFENLEERDEIQDGTEEVGSESDNVQTSVNKAVGPSKGMEFSNMAEAYDFYNRYAKARGFGIRRDSSSYSRKLNVVCRKVYVCDKEGAKRTYDAKQKGRVINRRAETRCHCRARMAIALSDGGKWIVKQFEDDHTHDLSAHSKVRKKCSHNQLISGLENSVQTSPDCGPKPPMDSQVLSHSSGALQTIDGSHQASQGHVGQRQKNYVKHHCMKIVEYLQHKSHVEEGFFFKAEVDSHSQVKSVFWADYRSRIAYMHFSDVISFDISYRSKIFTVPFAPFAGINHHRQSTLFGCALLTDETEDTFTWLFETWLECMWGKMPLGMIAEQDIAMQRAIGKVFPNTQHRFCSWHIENYVLPYLNQMNIRFPGFSKVYKEWIYSGTVEEFESRWRELKEKFMAHENSWLLNLYRDRHRWIRAYFKDSFFVHMTSTQQIETINTFFYGFINALTPLSEFVQQYNVALARRRSEEADEDYRSMHTKRELYFGTAIEEQASNVYTNKIFDIFQEELKQSMTYMCFELLCEGLTTTYEVKKDTHRWEHEFVTFEDGLDFSINCSCKKFQQEGIFCGHILRTLFQRNVLQIPEKYLMFRWSKSARHTSSAGLNYNFDSSNKTSSIKSDMIHCIHNTAYKIADMGSKSPQHWNLVMSTFKRLVDQLGNVTVSPTFEAENAHARQSESSASHLVDVSHINASDPQPIASKVDNGRGKN